MSKRFLLTIATLIVLVVVAAGAIFFAKGYTISTKDKRIVGTGIINVTSVPDAASVYIDGHLTTATNATVSSLSPRSYDVKVIKEGFIPWERQVDVKEGLVTALKITLFPAIPTIYPLTFTGVVNPVLSPDGAKLAYVVPSGKKAGVWVWTMSNNQPIAFARSAEPHQIVSDIAVDYSKAILRWSADSKQVLATVGSNNYLLDEGSLNTDPRDITAILDSTLQSWSDDAKDKETARVLSIKDPSIRQTASGSATIRWSPDETKFIYSNSVPSGLSPKVAASLQASASAQATFADDTGINFKMYDLETGKQYDIPAAKNHFWLPDSLHIVLVEDKQISIVDFDGTNKAVLYAGNFDNSLVFPWPDSSRLVIVSSFPTPTASEPNFYGINLR